MQVLEKDSLAKN